MNDEDEKLRNKQLSEFPRVFGVSHQHNYYIATGAIVGAIRYCETCGIFWVLGYEGERWHWIVVEESRQEKTNNE